NAIKHGISECVSGGEVRISARLEQPEDSSDTPAAVLITVIDTGVGVTETYFERRRHGVGLSNVEQRLQLYGGGSAPLVIRSTPGIGTTVEIRVPLHAWEPGNLAVPVKS